MLVITKLYVDDKELEFIVINSEYDPFNTAQCDVFDTKLNKVHTGVPIQELYNDFDNLIGVLHNKNLIELMPLDIITWKIMDYINEVQNLGVVQDTLSDFYKNLKEVKYKTIQNMIACEYNCDLSKIYYIMIPCSIEQLDSFGLYYKFGSIRITLSYFYSMLYELDTENCTALFIIDKNKNVIKLEVNKDIIRLLSKLKTIGSNKLCWS